MRLSRPGFGIRRTEGPAMPNRPSITPRDAILREVGAPDTDMGAEARRVLRLARHASLATLDAGSGYPFLSFAPIATDMAGAPLLRINRIALHTRNLLADPRISLMIRPEDDGSGRLLGARLTLTGRADPVEDPAAQRRYLARHPKMTVTTTLGGFDLWRVTLDGVDMLGSQLAPDLTCAHLRTDLAEAGALVEAEPDLLRRINAEHAQALRDQMIRQGREAGGWRAIGLDPEGIDLRFGQAVARIFFPAPATTPAALLEALLGAMQPASEPAAG